VVVYTRRTRPFRHSQSAPGARLGRALSAPDTADMDTVPLVGLGEIARMTGRSRSTVAQWRRANTPRGRRLPPPAVRISGSPLWTVPSILAFAAAHAIAVVWNPWVPAPVLSATVDVDGTARILYDG